MRAHTDRQTEPGSKHLYVTHILAKPQIPALHFTRARHGTVLQKKVAKCNTDWEEAHGLHCKTVKMQRRACRTSDRWPQSPQTAREQSNNFHFYSHGWRPTSVSLHFLAEPACLRNVSRKTMVGLERMISAVSKQTGRRDTLHAWLAALFCPSRSRPWSDIFYPPQPSHPAIAHTEAALL